MSTAKSIGAALLLAVPLLLPALPGRAEEPWHEGPRERFREGPPPELERREHRERREEFREHRRYPQSIEIWRGGRWYQGEHAGRYGWWWQVGPAWYFYAAPSYPYPEPPVIVPSLPPQPLPGYYYYCPNPPGYYPQVMVCTLGWQLLPAR